MDNGTNVSAARNPADFVFTSPRHSSSTVTVLIAMAVVIFVENVTVCALFATNKKLRSTTNVFVISLALSDLFVALLFVPVYLATPVDHAANLYVVTFLLFSSLFNLCGVTYDRYHAILQPLTYKTVFTSCRISSVLFCIWFFPVLLILLPVAWSGQSLQTRIIIDRVYLGFLVFIVFSACVVMSKVYFSIFKAIRRQLRMARYVKGMFARSERSSTTSIEKSSIATTISYVRADSPSLQARGSTAREETGASQETQPKKERNSSTKRSFRKLRNLRFKKYSEKVFNDMRAAKLFACIILMFVICWLPAVVINFMVAIGKFALIPQFIFDVSVYAFVANAMVNPLLFTFYKRDYRKAFVAVFSACCCNGAQKNSVINFDAIVLMMLN